MFEAVIVCLPFSQGNAVCQGFVWVTVCVLEEERTVNGVATQKMIFHAWDELVFFFFFFKCYKTIEM